ncbi:TPA: DUF551 domain-containing protein [Escherichia coli]|nr:DUF551 domain-containing protein [Escherichia coli]
MSTITKERIELFIKSPLENGLTRGEQMELARIALASLEAEPVAYIFKHPAGKLFWALTDESNKDQSDVIPVYATPPVPVVPEEKPMPNPLKMYAVDAVAAIAEVRGWNACRAAMLHSAEPASNHEELPLDYLQGQKDGLEWAAQLAEANHPQTGDWLYDDPLELAKAIRKGPDMPEFDGPTPVTPDGWISCSERMPDKLIPVMVMYEDGEMWSAMWNGNRWDDGTEYPDPHSVTHWREMPAAPQQEVK